jgi:hypothetical protein
MWEIEVPVGAKPLGYKKLVEDFDLKVIPHHCWSYVSPKSERRQYYFKDQNLTLYIYPNTYARTDSVFENLEFALKHEGLNFYILKQVLTKLKPTDLVTYITGTPTGKYARILWYLYENFNHVLLDLPDLNQGVYVHLVDPKKYFCGVDRRSRRHRVADNSLGNLEFSPSVRKTTLIKQYEKKHLHDRAQKIVQNYDPTLLARAMRYLYTKETISSWEIEREKPDNEKILKFVTLLHKAGAIGNLSEDILVELQKNIVDPRFALDAYRNFQNYVGEEPSLNKLIVHFISPRPTDVKNLMELLIESFQHMEKSDVDPVVVTGILSFMFVFIHPFEDGNGRLHRFLIHYALSRLKFTPEKLLLPVSAAIVRDPVAYDRVLETFSAPLMRLVTDYNVNDYGEMTVTQDTIDFYRYIDFTPIVEYLYVCVERTIMVDLSEELKFLANYDRIKESCKQVVDMPDQKLDLLIKCVRQNNGQLSSRKHESLFKMLSTAEITQMEKIISGES